MQMLTAVAAMTIAATLSAQIPEQAKWEITFAEVEAVAGLPDLRSAPPETFEARLMQRPWSAVAPMPFLRIVRTGGTLRPQLFLFWNPKLMAPGQRPKGADITCRDRVCVRPVELREQDDWQKVVASLARDNGCPSTNTNTVAVCADCDQIWAKTAVDGKYREETCGLGADSTLSRMLAFLKRAAGTAYQP